MGAGLQSPHPPCSVNPCNTDKIVAKRVKAPLLWECYVLVCLA